MKIKFTVDKSDPALVEAKRARAFWAVVMVAMFFMLWVAVIAEAISVLMEPSDLVLQLLIVLSGATLLPLMHTHGKVNIAYRRVEGDAIHEFARAVEREFGVTLEDAAVRELVDGDGDITFSASDFSVVRVTYDGSTVSVFDVMEIPIQRRTA